MVPHIDDATWLALMAGLSLPLLSLWLLYVAWASRSHYLRYAVSLGVILSILAWLASRTAELHEWSGYGHQEYFSGWLIQTAWIAAGLSVLLVLLKRFYVDKAKQAAAKLIALLILVFAGAAMYVLISSWAK